MKSMFGSPAAGVGTNRTVLLPAFSTAVSVLVDHAVHVPVPSNDTVATVTPLTTKFAGLALVVPLANRTPSVAVPAAAAFTVTSE